MLLNERNIFEWLLCHVEISLLNYFQCITVLISQIILVIHYKKDQAIKIKKSVRLFQLLMAIS